MTTKEWNVTIRQAVPEARACPTCDRLQIRLSMNCLHCGAQQTLTKEEKAELVKLIVDGQPATVVPFLDVFPNIEKWIEDKSAVPSVQSNVAIISLEDIETWPEPAAEQDLKRLTSPGTGDHRP